MHKLNACSIPNCLNDKERVLIDTDYLSPLTKQGDGRTSSKYFFEGYSFDFGYNLSYYKQEINA